MTKKIETDFTMLVRGQIYTNLKKIYKKFGWVEDKRFEYSINECAKSNGNTSKKFMSYRNHFSPDGSDSIYAVVDTAGKMFDIWGINWYISPDLFIDRWDPIDKCYIITYGIRIDERDYSIIECTAVEICEESDDADRITFIKTINGYEFLGVYKLLKSNLEPQPCRHKIYKRISDTYPF